MARRALVIGGGIGGLAVGVGLRRLGWDVQVFEQAPELRPIGAGLTIWANAVHALERLGVGQQVRDLNPQVASGGIYTSRGRPLAQTSIQRLEQAVGEVSVALHRAELHAILLGALGEEQLHTGMRCAGIEQHADGVTARFTDGSTAEGDVLIGADGLHSVVRQQLIGDGPPRYSGYTSWRAVVPFDHAQLHAGEYWGRGARFGIVPLSDGRVYWFATRNAPQGQRSAPEEERRALLRLFSHWCRPIPQLVEAAAPEAILRHDIADRPPLQRWGSGRVTLLGDAAHPMTPNMGQGACQALEDAVVLADQLAADANPVLALRTYEQLRIPRTTAIVNQSLRIGAVAQWDGALSGALRTLVMRATPDRLQERALIKLIGHQV